jgi:hypothetical protein
MQERSSLDPHAGAEVVLVAIIVDQYEPFRVGRQVNLETDALALIARRNRDFHRARDRSARGGRHPTARKQCSIRTEWYAFSDDSPIVATFED